MRFFARKRNAGIKGLVRDGEMGFAPRWCQCGAAMGATAPIGRTFGTTQQNAQNAGKLFDLSLGANELSAASVRGAINRLRPSGGCVQEPDRGEIEADRRTLERTSGRPNGRNLRPSLRRPMGQLLEAGQLSEKNYPQNFRAPYFCPAKCKTNVIWYNLDNFYPSPPTGKKNL